MFSLLAFGPSVGTMMVDVEVLARLLTGAGEDGGDEEMRAEDRLVDVRLSREVRGVTAILEMCFKLGGKNG
jgi:hypothetical protein